MGVAPWFSLPALARAVRSRKVSAASVVSTHPCAQTVAIFKLQNAVVNIFKIYTVYDVGPPKNRMFHL